MKSKIKFKKKHKNHQNLEPWDDWETAIDIFGWLLIVLNANEKASQGLGTGKEQGQIWGTNPRFSISQY